MSFFTAIFGDPSEKKLRQYQKELDIIKTIETKYKNEITSIEQVQAKTHEFQSRFSGLDHTDDVDYAKIRETLESVKHEAIALHRRACELIYDKEFDLGGDKKIVWNMIPYDVQILGAMALHDGNISEMRTGEGKTLVATISAYLNALTGIPVHIVTVNDYLAARDAKEMSIIYATLGLTTGVIVHGQSPSEKKEQYSKSIVYATNNELGFDYLRDNMAPSEERKVMGPLLYAIIDEVDSILVDEARTPLIISAPDSEPTTKYVKFAAMARKLESEKHYKIDEKQKTATLTEEGIQEVENFLGVDNIYVSQHYNDLHHIENALKAATVYKRDVDYLVRNDEVYIIDEHTGRVLGGRRYSDGLHQAIEAKENVPIQQESKTLASITFQNYFRLYRKLSGMTGTAKTEEEEFYKIYRLEVISVPTNKPMRRIDRGDILFRTEKGKFAYIVKLITELHKEGQPILVGTVSVAKSEYLSGLLTQAGVPHEVLNAKQDSREAEIIAKAGTYGAVTIATNMAGRGTDIKIDERVRTLSGEVTIAGAAGNQAYPLGGLYVIGTEKHETRRIDNQLRGRSGRQGDPGLSQFMLSPQDDIMRVFGGNKLFAILANFEGHPEGDPLVESKMLARNITTIQKQVEGRNFDIRKHILEYDDVLNHHRLAIYARRNKILSGNDIHDEILRMLGNQLSSIITGVKEIKVTTTFDDEDKVLLIEEINRFVDSPLATTDTLGNAETWEEAESTLSTLLKGKIETLGNTGTDEEFANFERTLTLTTIDELWMNHIDAMAHLREEVAFEGYAQKNPLIIYKERAYDKFIELIRNIEHRIIKGLLTAKPRESIDTVKLEEILMSKYQESGIAGFAGTNILEMEGPPHKISLRSENERQQAGAEVTSFPVVGRNDPCPCGSGKKYKNCHGA